MILLRWGEPSLYCHKSFQGDIQRNWGSPSTLEETPSNAITFFVFCSGTELKQIRYLLVKALKVIPVEKKGLPNPTRHKIQDQP